MARLFGRLPSELLLVADLTVAYAVDAAATLLLVQCEREEREIGEARKFETFLAGAAGRSSEIEWETVQEL